MPHAPTLAKSVVDLVVPPFVAIEPGAARAGGEPATLTGKVRLRLAEPTTFKHIAVDLRGVLTVMPVSTGRTWRADTRLVHMSSQVLLDSKIVLGAGLHEFDFALPLPADAPCTLPDIGGMARVSYTLRARAVRARSLFPSLAAECVVTLVRTYARESVEFQNVYEGVYHGRGLTVPATALTEICNELCNGSQLCVATRCGIASLRVATSCNGSKCTLATSPATALHSPKCALRRCCGVLRSESTENVWRGKAIYSVALPHRAWAAGDTLMALVKLVPLSKDATPRVLRMSLREDVRIVTSNGPRAFTRHVATAAHPVVFPPSASSSSSQPNSQQHLMSAPSDPGPFALPIPPKTIPTYRSPLVTVKHHLDLLVQFEGPEDGGTRTRFTCHTVSLALRVLAHPLLPSARHATLDNRRALFGPLPALMSLPSPEDQEGEEEQDLPSYAAHVQDFIPVPGGLDAEDESEEGVGGRRSMDTVRSIDSVAMLDPRRISRVPDYGAALESVVVPLWSVRGLPSYAEAQRAGASSANAGPSSSAVAGPSAISAAAR